MCALGGDLHCARVVELGGKVLIPPQRLPAGEVMAIVHDPEGIPLGLFQPAPSRPVS